MILAPHDPAWPGMAASEIARWRAALPDLVAVHHIGSTSVPGLCAKPILDLMPVFATEAAADAAQPILEALGYEWLGEHGLPGRRYCRRSDAATGLRRVQAHGYVTGHPDIARHLAFRDWLGADAAHRDAYAAEKSRCAALHPGDGSAYGDCKSAWIDAAEQRALRDGRDRRW